MRRLGWTVTNAGQRFFIRQLHARSGRAALVAGYTGKNATFDDAIVHFALEAPRTDGDDAALVVALGLVGVLKATVTP